MIGSSSGRWLRTLGVAAVGLSIVLIAAGSAYERIGRARAAREYPPPGTMVDIGGRRIQLDCRGEGSPTVVFEAGLDISGSLAWSAVHDAIARHTRACAYSRAGMMWSDRAAAPMSARRVAEDLHAALNRSGEQAPFVLVGHSLGGPYVMTFTKYFGDDVSGLVLVDASHPEQVQRLGAMASEDDDGLLDVAASLAWSGFLRVAAPAWVASLPNQSPAQRAAVRAYAPTSLSALADERHAIAATLSEAGTFRHLGHRPLYVLTALRPPPDAGRDLQAVWRQLQGDMATWSSQSTHVVLDDSGHDIPFEKPDEVVKAVLAVVGQVRAPRSTRP